MLPLFIRTLINQSNISIAVAWLGLTKRNVSSWSMVMKLKQFFSETRIFRGFY